MTNPSLLPNRRDLTQAKLQAGAALASGTSTVPGADAPTSRIRTGVIGCGSVSGAYLPVPTKCRFIKVVSLCSMKPERAKGRAGIGNRHT